MCLVCIVLSHIYTRDFEPCSDTIATTIATHRHALAQMRTKAYTKNKIPNMLPMRFFKHTAAINIKGNMPQTLKKDANGAYGGAQNGGSMILGPHTHLTESPG